MSILIKHVELNGNRTDIAIEGNRIADIGPQDAALFDTVVDGSYSIAVPAFYNCHTHSPMTLLRGYADDMELMDWLNNHIWPAEAKLQPEDIYWGTRLACMEMIHSGTVYFNDMYFMPSGTVRAVEESGLRATIGMFLNDAAPSKEMFEKDSKELWERRDTLSPRIQLSIAPHAIYTCGEKTLRECAEMSQQYGIQLHVHVAETKTEFDGCKEQHGGMTPVEYLDTLGVLSERTFAAHSVHVTEHDMEILAERGVHCVFNPVSNLKLMSGLLPLRRMLDKGVSVVLGTDGTSSNNNLSMFDEMKVASLVSKLANNSPIGAQVDEIYKIATRNGAVASGLDAGVIEKGRLADIVLLDASSAQLTPSYNLVSNLVYSADTSCVKTVICDGKILMRDGFIEGEAEVIENARRCAKRLLAAARG